MINSSLRGCLDFAISRDKHMDAKRPFRSWADLLNPFKMLNSMKALLLGFRDRPKAIAARSQHGGKK